MKLRILTSITTITLAIATGLISSVNAQESQPVRRQVTPTAQVQQDANMVLEACAKDEAQTLVNPFKDVSPNHWAFKAVLSIYYCGAYRGSSPPAKVKPFLEQTPQPQSNNQQYFSLVKW